MGIDTKHKVPALRFPGFNGEWEEKKLGDLATRQKKKNINLMHKRVFSNSAIQGVIDQKDCFDHAIAKAENLDAYYIIEKGDYVYNPRISASAPAGPIKRNDLGVGVVSPLYTVFRFKFNNTVFFEKYFSSCFWHSYMKSVANYGARFDRMAISMKDFMNMPLPYPVLKEQQKIADFLTSVDTKIEQLNKKKALLEQYKKGMMQKLFSQALRFKDEAGNDFPDWEEKKLGDLATRQKKKNINLMHKRVFSNSAIQGVIDQKDCFDHAIAKAENLDAYYIIEKGDYVYNPRISASAPAGPIKRNDLGVGVVSPLYTVFRFKFNNTVFFEKYFSSCFWHSYMKSVANYGARFDRMAISMKDFMNMPLPYPVLKEQQKIADFLSAIDRKIALTDTQLTGAKAFKKGLLQRMFA